MSAALPDVARSLRHWDAGHRRAEMQREAERIEAQWRDRMKAPGRLDIIRRDARDDLGQGWDIALIAAAYADELKGATACDAIRFACWLVAS